MKEGPGSGKGGRACAEEGLRDSLAARLLRTANGDHPKLLGCHTFGFAQKRQKTLIGLFSLLDIFENPLVFRNLLSPSSISVQAASPTEALGKCLNGGVRTTFGVFVNSMSARV